MDLNQANILCMINARGGSKGVHRKNVRPLMGKPLIVWSIETARQARYIDRVMVSTDDDEIAEVARRFGAEVPFMRPAELAADASLQFDTIRYNIEMLEADGPQIDIVVLLQPTCPLRAVEDVEGCLELMAETGADTVITISELRHFHPMGIWRLAEGSKLASYQATEPAGFNRQGLGTLYWRTGSVYVMRRDIIIENNAIYGNSVHGYQVNAPRSWFNIDNEFDWQLTEAWIRYQSNT